MRRPSLEETVTGIFLHDIGKVAQRAAVGSSGQRLPDAVQKLASDILPQWNGRPTHWHALWSEAFFHWMEERGISFPCGLNRSAVRDVAVFHHVPENARREIGAVADLVAEADRLSSGMDRKPRDEEHAEKRGGEDFARTPLLSPFVALDLGREGGRGPQTYVPAVELRPGDALTPRKTPDLDLPRYPQRYAELYRGFQDAFSDACANQSFAVFAEALLSASQRFLHAVPSSTVDQPDISLHDHAHAAAAVGAALYRWHAAQGDLDHPAAVRDRSVAKFRFLAGDLSGIQSTLFQLAHQQVKGVNRILRARSFEMGLLTEAAALECRKRLGLPPFSVVQNAGGRFLMLVDASNATARAVDEIRKIIEAWMFERWRGELALHLALTEPFSGADLMLDRFHRLQSQLGQAVEEAKLRPFSTCLYSVHTKDRYPEGACVSCGVRPARTTESRCEVCDQEHRLGSSLPRLRVLTWERSGGEGLAFWGDLRCRWHEEEEPAVPATLESAVRFWSEENSGSGKIATRFYANYVPRMGEDEVDKPVYEGLEKLESGAMKQFEHIAAEALEGEPGAFRGEDFLAVLKADVDHLGALFRQGLEHPTLGRVAGLSRMLDFFFTGQLPHLLRHDARFRNTYTVFAGGDDLLLIGPWRQTAELACALESAFRSWTGNNPQVTLSSSLDLVRANQPLNRTVRRAEERLHEAKEAGRNRVSAFAPDPMRWEDYRMQLEKSARLRDLIVNGEISMGFAYRMLSFERARQRVEPSRKNGSGCYPKARLSDIDWRSRWGYQLARNLSKADPNGETVRFLNGLLGLDSALQPVKGAPSSEAAMILAIYRSRKAKGRN